MAREGRLFRRIRIVYILPMVIAPIVVGIIWRLLYATGVGALPYFASLLGVRNFDILSSPQLALPGLVLLDIWEWTPFMFLVLLAGIQSLPSEPIEAARVDGASAPQIFLTIMLPMLRPIILVALLVRTMDAFTIFDQVFVLTNGGPGVTTQVISLYAYNTAFRFSQLGYAAAMVFCMLLFLVTVSVVLVRLMRRNLVAR
jgi:multiple sugar transport system permease protein